MNKTLRDQVMKLPPDERAELAQELWDSVHPPGSVRPDESAPLTKEQMAEIDRRLAEHERDPGSAIPWDVVKAQLRARLK